MNDRLLAYVASAALDSPECLRKAIGDPTAEFANASYLDVELRSLWPELSLDARLLAILLAQVRAEEANNNYD